MKIAKNKVVSVTYELSTKDESGQIVLLEKADPKNPMVFLFGHSGLPEKFEAELDGLDNGSAFQFTLESDEAYGDFEDEAVVRLPLDIFKVEGQFNEKDFPVGTFVPMSDSEGNMMQGRVLEVTDKDIQMDFNHPLAGMDLYFKGTVVEVRDASAEEIAHGHAHGPGGHHHH
ncbi:MAG: peptidylprolyl isomerase [Cytophagaceae bacterium]|nr:peptidylprolyl isomerase [Cytophagaceae bacterium]